MLELRNVSFGVSEDSGQKEILKNISFQLEDNKFTVITGPNGGGKSTLAKVIAGIDLWSFQKLISVFEKMHDSGSHKSIFIISHQERILNIADEIMMIADGQLTARGTKEEILPQILSRTVSCGCIYRAQD